MYLNFYIIIFATQAYPLQEYEFVLIKTITKQTTLPLWLLITMIMVICGKLHTDLRDAIHGSGNVDYNGPPLDDVRCVFGGMRKMDGLMRFRQLIECDGFVQCVSLLAIIMNMNVFFFCHFLVLCVCGKCDVCLHIDITLIRN